MTLFPLHSLRFTPMIYDTAIIGAGINGCSCAYFLREAGQNVVLIDREGIASGGSGAAGAFNVRITFDPAQSVVVNRAVPGLAAGAAAGVRRGGAGGGGAARGAVRGQPARGQHG